MSNNRWLVIPFALCLSLCLMMSFAPFFGAVHSQLDFILLWGIALILTALPMLYLEVALAKRSKISVIQALSSLTRDADAPTFWRAMGWAGALFISFLAGGLLNLTVSQLAIADISTQIILAILIVATIILSALPRMILITLLILGVIISPFMGSVDINPLQWTAVSGLEWGLAVTFALFATGLGMSVYWQQVIGQSTNDAPATPIVLPIFIALLIAGLIYAVLPLHYNLANIALSAILVQFARQQWLDRKIILPVAWVLPLAMMGLWFILPTKILIPIAVAWGLVLCFVYSVFAGWIMKASHLRKSLNFSNELFYNLWRVAVRILVPLNIIIALIMLVRG